MTPVAGAGAGARTGAGAVGPGAGTAHAHVGGRVVVLRVPVAGPALVCAVSGEGAPGSSRWPLRWVDTVEGHPIAWYADRSQMSGLPVNASAWALAARLGCPDLADRIGLHGDLLLAGLTREGRPSSVPRLVVDAAGRAGLFTIACTSTDTTSPAATSPVSTGGQGEAEVRQA